MRVRTDLKAGTDFNTSVLESAPPTAEDFRIGVLVERINQQLQLRWYFDNLDGALPPEVAAPVRHWAVDAAQGVVLGALTLQHFLLLLLGTSVPPLGQGLWLLTLGALLAAGYDHARQHQATTRFSFSAAWQAGEWLAWGGLLSLLSLWLLPQTPLLFGTLQVLGVSTLLALPLLRLPSALHLSAGAVALGAGWLGRNVQWAWPWAALLGLPPQPLFDFVPLLPGLGCLLIGLFLGQKLLGAGSARLPNWEQHKAVRWLADLGRDLQRLYLNQVPLVIALKAVGI